MNFMTRSITKSLTTKYLTRPMRLEGSFYKIREARQTDNHISVIVELEPEHPIYEGHFPQQPVVPGVCTMTIVKECLSEVLGRTCNYESIKECKFTSALIPSEGLRLNLEFDVLEDMQIKGTVCRADDGQTVIKLKAKLN